MVLFYSRAQMALWLFPQGKTLSIPNSPHSVPQTQIFRGFLGFLDFRLLDQSI